MHNVFYTYKGTVWNSDGTQHFIDIGVNEADGAHVTRVSWVSLSTLHVDDEVHVVEGVTASTWEAILTAWIM